MLSQKRISTLLALPGFYGSTPDALTQIHMCNPLIES